MYLFGAALVITFIIYTTAAILGVFVFRGLSLIALPAMIFSYIYLKRIVGVKSLTKKAKWLLFAGALTGFLTYHVFAFSAFHPNGSPLFFGILAVISWCIWGLFEHRDIILSKPIEYFDDTKGQKEDYDQAILSKNKLF